MFRKGIAATGLVAVSVLAAACGGHSHSHPQASAAASSAKAAVIKDVGSPKVLAAEKKLAPKFQTCLGNEGAHVKITGAGTTAIKVVPQDIKLRFMAHAVHHPFRTLEGTAQCAGLTKAQMKGVEAKVPTIVAANGFGKGSFGMDVRELINVAAVQVAA